MRRGTAYGLDSPRDVEDWRELAACRFNPELWHPRKGKGTGALPAHICLSHCPVRERCEVEELPARGWVEAIVAGRRFSSYGKEVPVEPLRRGCPLCPPPVILPEPRPVRRAMRSGRRRVSCPTCGRQIGYTGRGTVLANHYPPGVTQATGGAFCRGDAA